MIPFLGQGRRTGLALLGSALLVGVALLVALPRRVELEVGAHRISVTRPRGFQSVARDKSCLFRNGPILLELQDLGAPGGDPDFEQPLQFWIDWAMSWLETSTQRGVARTGSLEVQGRDFRIVETWDAATHTQRRRFAFAVNDGSLLVLHTRGGDFDLSSTAFDRVLRSLVFDDA